MPGNIPVEQTPEGISDELAEYLTRMFTLINAALYETPQLDILTAIPAKPLQGKIYFFGQAIPATAITQEGYWGYTSATGWVLLG